MNKLILILMIALGSRACYSEESPSPTAALKKESHDLTHTLVCKDSTFRKSIQGILPNGVKRMEDADLSTITLANSSSKSPSLTANVFQAGKSKISELKKTLGAPVNRLDDKWGGTVLSYDAQNNNIVTFVFGKNEILENEYLYSVDIQRARKYFCVTATFS